jgi:frataxin
MSFFIVRLRVEATYISDGRGPTQPRDRPVRSPTRFFYRSLGSMSIGTDAGSDDESAFHAAADRTLAHLLERIEDSLGDELDVDLQGGILTIELASGGQYVVNKHAPNRQIWLSSPVSGAAHFGHERGRGWISTRGGAALHELLAQELRAATGTFIELDFES